MEHYITINIPIHLSSEDYSILSQAMEEYNRLVKEAFRLIWYGVNRTEIYSRLRNELRILNTRYLLAAISDAAKAVKSKKKAYSKYGRFRGYYPRLFPQLRTIGRKQRGTASSIRINFDSSTLTIRLKNGIIIAKMKLRTYHKRWLNYLQEKVNNKEISYTVRIIKRWNKPLAQITFQIQPNIAREYKGNILGIDFNANCITYALVDKDGNLLKVGEIKHENDLTINMKKSERIRILGKSIKKLIKIAKRYQAAIAIEDLSLFPIINKNSKLRQLPHRKFRNILIAHSAIDNITLIFVNPAHTSNIATYKYTQIKATVHKKAAYVIARRALGIIEKIPLRFLEYKTFRKMIPKKWEILAKKVNKTRIAWNGPHVRFVP